MAEERVLVTTAVGPQIPSLQALGTTTSSIRGRPYHLQALGANPLTPGF